VSFWEELETKPLSLEDMERFKEQVLNEPKREPTYVVCLEDWKKINALSQSKHISLFSAYLKLLNSGKVRPAFQQ